MVFFDKNESIIFEIRKHWIMLWTPLIILGIFALFPLLIVPVFFTAGASIKLMALATFFIALFYFIIWIACFIVWTNFYLDVWVVTNHKILSVDQQGLFSRSTSIIHLDKIQDINFRVTGILASIFDYGDLEVKTAAHTHDQGFLMRGIPNPSLIQAKINEALIVHRQEIQKESTIILEEISESKDPVSDLVNQTINTEPSESEPV